MYGEPHGPPPHGGFGGGYGEPGPHGPPPHGGFDGGYGEPGPQGPPPHGGAGFGVHIGF